MRATPLSLILAAVLLSTCFGCLVGVQEERRGYGEQDRRGYDDRRDHDRDRHDDRERGDRDGDRHDDRGDRDDRR